MLVKSFIRISFQNREYIYMTANPNQSHYKQRTERSKPMNKNFNENKRRQFNKNDRNKDYYTEP